jgi:SAM-dependent methyltransferase
VVLTVNSDGPCDWERGYTAEFFAEHAPGSRRSALEILPRVLEWIPVSSVVDVGCGVGTWLSVIRELGVSDTLGVDGPHLDATQLLIPSLNFLAADLAAPPPLGRTFDLAMSLEVAEHLPPAAARPFITYLTTLAPVVLFSAAIPGQGGVNHVNEQWPSYWAALFGELDFVTIDSVRSAIWNDENIDWWYAQNVLLFAEKSYVNRSPVLQLMVNQTDLRRLDVVHPRALETTRRATEALQHRLQRERQLHQSTLRTWLRQARNAFTRSDRRKR